MTTLPEIREKMQQACDTKLKSTFWKRVRCPSLIQMARYINATMPQYNATVRSSWSNTDRKIGRLRSPGKGREGNKLTVKDSSEHKVFEHDSSETYRHNTEVAQWIFSQECEGERRWPPGEM